MHVDVHADRGMSVVRCEELNHALENIGRLRNLEVALDVQRL